jgi:hypothetical protein
LLSFRRSPWLAAGLAFLSASASSGGCRGVGVFVLGMGMGMAADAALAEYFDAGAPGWPPDHLLGTGSVVDRRRRWMNVRPAGGWWRGRGPDTALGVASPPSHRARLAFAMGTCDD